MENYTFIKVIEKRLLARYKRLSKVPIRLYSSRLNKLLIFIKSTPVLKGIMQNLFNQVQNPEELFNTFKRYDYTFKDDISEIESVIIAFYVLNEINDPKYKQKQTLIRIFLGSYCSHETTTNEDYISMFKHVYVKPICDYLLEKIDSSLFILDTLNKYKKKIEWFSKDQLNHILESNKSKGEDNLAMTFYEFAFDLGIEFVIEPKSPNGRIDIIISQETGEKIIGDAKIFDGVKRTKAYLKKGLNQVLSHMKEENQNFGFLLIYNTSPKFLSLDFSKTEQGFPLLEIDHKIIYFIMIDIYRFPQSASNRKKIPIINVEQSYFE